MNVITETIEEPGLKFDKIYEVYSQRFQTDDLEPGEKFDPKVMPNAHLTNPTPGSAFVYVCTIQRMARYLFADHPDLRSGPSADLDLGTRIEGPQGRQLRRAGTGPGHRGAWRTSARGH